MKKITAVALALATVLALFSLAGCGKKIPDTATAEGIAGAVDAAVGDDGMMAVDEQYASIAMRLDVAGCDSWVAKINAYGVNIDEYGVFKCADEAAAEAFAAEAEAYLQYRKDSWMPEYMPEQFPKLEAAECRTLGCYVMYAILSDEGRSAAFDAFDAAVRKG